MNAPAGLLIKSNKPLFKLFVFLVFVAPLLLVNSSSTFGKSIIKMPPDATLASLKLSAGALDPVFSADVTNYTICIDTLVSSVIVTPKAATSTSTIAVNGNSLASGDTSVNIPLTTGASVITITVTAADGITTQTYTVNVTRPATAIGDDDAMSVNEFAEKPTFDDDVLVVHRGVTPNGDGIDDHLVIDGILAYPDNKLTIVNRNGQLIYESKGYDNSTRVFDGRSSLNGQMQQPGTYFFELDYAVSGIVKHKTGFIVLKY